MLCVQTRTNAIRSFYVLPKKLEVVLVIDAICDGSLVVDGRPRQKVCVPGPVLANSLLFDFSENMCLHLWQHVYLQYSALFASRQC